MKEGRKNSIDKFFQESLDGHKVEPTASVWESLASHIPSGSGNGTFMFLLAALAIGVFSFFVISGLNTGQELVEMTKNIETINVDTESAIVEAEIVQATSSSDDEKPAEVSITPSKQDIVTLESSNEPYSPSAERPYKNDNAVAKAAEDDSKENKEETSFDHSVLDYMEYRYAIIELESTTELSNEDARDSGDPIFDLSINDGYVKKADVLFGAGFSPAVNIYPDGQNRNDYSLELIAAYEKSRFILEGGVGANYTTESVKYGVNYSSYDSVGYFINVNSFSIDPGNPDSIRFETSLKNIYDSISHYRIQENTNKYAYLQIPVRIGYRLIEKDRFSLDLKVGILFSLQVYKDVPEVPYQGSDAEQIEVILHYPDRLKTNWQYTAGVGMNYHINRNLRFTLEPFYRQYIKSVYSSDSEYSARSPYAFGIRGGLYFHF